MPRHRQKIIAMLRVAILLIALVAGLPPWLVKAASNSRSVRESIAIEGSVTNSTINNTVNKRDPAVLAAMAKTFADQMTATTEAKAQAEARAAELATKFGFTSAAVGEFFKILGEQNVPDEKVPARLIEIATHFAQTRDELAALAPDDPHTGELAHLARQALDSGRLAEADGLLRRAQEGELAALRQARELKEKAREDPEDHHSLNAAKMLAGRGNIALIQLHYVDAAGHFKEAATLVPPGHPDEAANYLHVKPMRFIARATSMATTPLWNNPLRLGNSSSSTARASGCRSTGRRPRTTSAMRSGRSGERESGTARLEEAVAAYRAALEEWTRERVPLDWAMTQNNLGTALRRSGERESGTARLEEAVAAYRAALEERTRERVPLDWAMTQNNLGTALSSARASGRAGRRGWRRRSRPSARRWRKARASGCRSTGRRPRTTSAPRFERSGSGRAGRRGWRRRSRPTARRWRNGRASGCRSTGR